MEVLLAVVGLLGGLLLSIAFWWFANHRLVPKLVFSTGISKRLDDEAGQAVYRFKVMNSGKRRDIIDISLRARILLPRYTLRLHTPGFIHTIIDIPLDVGHIYVLKPQKIRIVWLTVEEIEESVLNHLDADLRNRVAGRLDKSLEGLLGEIRPDAYLHIQALAYDAFSGARKYYSSPKYSATDITLGVFDGLSLKPDAV